MHSVDALKNRTVSPPTAISCTMVSILLIPIFKTFATFSTATSDTSSFGTRGASHSKRASEQEVDLIQRAPIEPLQCFETLGICTFSSRAKHQQNDLHGAIVNWPLTSKEARLIEPRVA
ncbi:hypothetical protein KP509_29G011100 [Ceratopteris richardii]|uniref:Uncharacterized protein n=1 Tax=Ceratopteris richardii TaxID=49495 RepID=A0A8T2R6E6_CERRI|nr:hypothetical protein KP509_29G011100 [Ceratopteris richardii]